MLLSQVKDRLTCCSGCTSFTPGHNLRCSCKPTDILYACLCTLCLEETGLQVPELHVYPCSHSHATGAPLHQHSAISLSTTLLMCRVLMPPSCHRQGSAQCKIIVVHVVLMCRASAWTPTLTLAVSVSATSSKAKSVGKEAAAFCRSTHFHASPTPAKALATSALWLSTDL